MATIPNLHERSKYTYIPQNKFGGLVYTSDYFRIHTANSSLPFQRLHVLQILIIFVSTGIWQCTNNQHFVSLSVTVMLSYLSVGKRKSKVTSIRFRYISTFNL